CQSSFSAPSCFLKRNSKAKGGQQRIYRVQEVLGPRGTRPIPPNRFPGFPLKGRYPWIEYLLEQCFRDSLPSPTLPTPSNLFPVFALNGLYHRTESLLE